MKAMETTIRGKTPTGTEYTATYVEDSVPRFRIEVSSQGIAFMAGYDKRHDALMAVESVPGTRGRVGLKLDARAREWIRPILAEHERREEERKRQLREKIEEERQRRLAPFFARARETGERVKVRSWTTGCSSRHEECDMDIVTEWALPDGKTETTRAHTW